MCDLFVLECLIDSTVWLHIDKILSHEMYV